MSNKNNIDKRTIWITGASSGIGEALAIKFASLGERVILSGRNAAKLEEVKARCQNAEQHILVPFDLADAEQAQQAYQTVKTAAKRIDWLINNAGVSQRSLIMDTSEVVERKLMEVDYFAQTRLTRLVLPDMIAQGGGKIVMVSSIAGLLGTQYRGAYGAAKAALHMWANSLRAELHDQGIQVATVFPGFITTNVSINALTGDGSVQGTMDETTGAGMSATDFAERVATALLNDQEYVVVGGRKELLATLANRFSPSRLYKIIRKSKVK